MIGTCWTACDEHWVDAKRVGKNGKELRNWQTLIFVYLATDNVGQLNQNYDRGVNDS